SLTERETERLFALIDQAKKTGVGIIYITHRMGEIRRIGDRITVLRDGRKIATLDAKTASDDRLIELMTGRVITQIFPKVNYTPGATLLEVDGVSIPGTPVRNVSISVRAGEIGGIAGLVGSGKSNIGRACFGLEAIARGSIRFEGEEVTGKPVAQMLKRGVFYLPSDRRAEGLVLVRGARENIALPVLKEREFSYLFLLKRGEEKERTQKLAKRVE